MTDPAESGAGRPLLGSELDARPPPAEALDGLISGETLVQAGGSPEPLTS